MSEVGRRSRSSWIALVLFAGCSDAGRSLDGSLGVVEVIETPPPIALVREIVAPPMLPSLSVFQPVVPEFVYVEPLPLPVNHVVRAANSPSGAMSLGVVQSVEVEVEIRGGSAGNRHIAAVFVSPQGLVWERQATIVEGKPGETQLAHFSLPVAATFIEEQQLSGTWQITTLDEGVEQASATFALVP
jgi:hypothetical protein